MECGSGHDNDDLQRRVLQSTLDEVAAREERATDCCVICLEIISAPCDLLPCGHHNFDYLCIISWLYETPVCPLCKAPVSRVLHRPPQHRQTTFFDLKPQPPKASQPPRSSRRFLPSSLDDRRVRPPIRRSRDRQRTELGFPATPLDEVGGKRHEIYRHKLYSKHVGSNRLSHYRELTPAMFCNDNELVSRARMWIRRELQVFSFLVVDETETMMPRSEDGSARVALERRRANNAEFLMEYIVAILKTVDIMGSAGQAEDMLSDFLGREHTRLFLHELRAWLRSPYTKLEDWDRAVQYDTTELRDRPTTTNSDPRQNQNGHRGTSDRDSYRPNNSPRRHHKRRHSSRYEPYRNRGHRSETKE